MTSDPIGLAGGINTYAYVANNPLSWIDPYGLRYSPYEHGMDWNGNPVDPTPVNLSVGFGGSGILGVMYGSADSGFAFDTTGNACFYSTLCYGYGWNIPIGGELGIVGSAGPGELCSGVQEYSGIYWAGGAGLVGQGQVFSNGSIAGGLGVGGSPEGPMGGVGGLTCATTYQCLFD